MRERLTSVLTEDPATADDSGINKTLREVKNPDVVKAEKDYRDIGGDALNEKNIKNYDPC
jgi:hypothetical protein